MRITCVKDKLKIAVALAEKITGKNLSLPVLSSVLLIAKDKTLKIRATNLDIGIEIEIPANITKEGITAVPGNIFSNLLSNIYSNSLDLELDNNNLLVTTKNSSSIIKCCPHDDFPTLPNISKGEIINISVNNFIEGLRSVLFSTSFSDIKPEISSVNIYTDSGDIVFAATDSFRLAEKKIKMKGSEKISSLLIPYKNISEIIRVFSIENLSISGNSDISGDISLVFNNNQISFKYGGMFVTSRLVEGVFPDYKQIFPKEFTTEIIVLKQDLINSLKLTNLFSDKFNQININVNKQKNIINISSQNTDIGENKIKLDGAITGENITLNFNHKYILDCFQSIPKDSVSLRFNGESKPVIIQGVGDKSFTYLVMPLNQ